jgi:hypothetical protein
MRRFPVNRFQPFRQMNQPAVDIILKSVSDARAVESWIEIESLQSFDRSLEFIEKHVGPPVGLSNFYKSRLV